MSRYVVLALSLLCACEDRPAPVALGPQPVIDDVRRHPIAPLIQPSMFSDLAAASGAPRRAAMTDDELADHLGPGPFAVDGTDIYAADGDFGEILVQPGGAWERGRVIARAASEEILGLAIDSTHVYFATVVRTNDGSRSVFAVRAVPKAGGVARVIARGECTFGVVHHMFVHGDHVYWVHTQGESSADTEAMLQRVPRAGGDPEIVARGLGGFYAVAVSGDSIVYAAADGMRDRLMRVGAAEPLAEADERIGEIAGDARAIYYTVRTDRGARVMQVGRAEPIATYDGFPDALAFDGGRVYWAEFGGEALDVPMRLKSAEAVAATGIRRGRYWSVANGRLYQATDRGVVSSAL